MKEYEDLRLKEFYDRDDELGMGYLMRSMETDQMLAICGSCGLVVANKTKHDTVDCG